MPFSVDKWNTSKLQRNALSVTEAPTGNEDDDDLDLENTVRNGSNYMSKFDYLSFFKISDFPFFSKKKK